MIAFPASLLILNGKSADSGAKSALKNDFWHHYRHFYSKRLRIYTLPFIVKVLTFAP